VLLLRVVLYLLVVLDDDVVVDLQLRSPAEVRLLVRLDEHCFER
jgi:hypothetical protein